MILSSFDIDSLKLLQLSQRKLTQVFAGIKVQYYFCFNDQESQDNVCGVDGVLLDVRPHETNGTKVYIDIAIKSHVSNFYISYENVEVVRLYTNDPTIEAMFGYIFADANKAESILETCNVENCTYLFLEDPAN